MEDSSTSTNQSNLTASTETSQTTISSEFNTQTNYPDVNTPVAQLNPKFSKIFKKLAYFISGSLFIFVGLGMLIDGLPLWSLFSFLIAIIIFVFEINKLIAPPKPKFLHLVIYLAYFIVASLSFIFGLAAFVSSPLLGIVFLLLTVLFLNYGFFWDPEGAFKRPKILENWLKQRKLEKNKLRDINLISDPVIPERPSCASEDVRVSVSSKSTSIVNEFSDIVVSGEQEYKQSIPVRPSPASKDVRNFVSMHDPETKFFIDMERNASREGKTAAFVPFKAYWPTYDSMNKAQQAWYFYWRSQIRQRNYMDTDLSYIFVLIYELLSGIGWQDPQEGYQKLMQLWAEYRKKFPSLDHYLTSWTFDFTQQYNLEYRLPDVDVDLQFAPSVITDILIAQHAEYVPLKLHFSLINALSDYSLIKSKFYKDGNQDLVHEAIPKVIALSDAVLRKNKQNGILDTYGPPSIKKQEYYAFTSAVCPQANKKIYVTVKDYSTYPKLRAYISELVRYSENTLRELRGYQGRLRGVMIDEETAKLVKDFLKEDYGQQATQENEPSKETKVILDVEKIKKLRVNSDAVRTALEVKETTIPETKALLTNTQEVTKEYGQQATQENEPPKETKVILDVEKIKKLRVDSDAVRTALEVKEMTIPEKKALLTDVQEVTAIYTAISPSARSLLDRLEKSSWECSVAQGDEPLIAEINRLAERYLGCSLVVAEASKIIAEDDYRDELEYIYQNHPVTSSEENGSKLFDSSVLTPEMKEFVNALLPVQQKVLYVLITSENTQSDLERIAEEELTMPQLLLDDINDLALQLMRDIIVDAADQKPHILDEYIDLLKQSVA